MGLSLFCSLLGFSWPLWCSLGPLLASVGLSGALFGSLLAPSWPLLGPSWLLWSPLGALLASLGRLLGLSWASPFERSFPIFRPLFVQLWIHFLGSSSVPGRTFFGVQFLNQFLTVFGSVWGVIFCTFSSFFALGRHLGEAAFSKDLPCEMLFFGGEASTKPSEKQSRRRSKKGPPPKTRKNTDNDPPN